LSLILFIGQDSTPFIQGNDQLYPARAPAFNRMFVRRNPAGVPLGYSSKRQKKPDADCLRPAGKKPGENQAFRRRIAKIRPATLVKVASAAAEGSGTAVVV
jgi:hypothetical protein